MAENGDDGSGCSGDNKNLRSEELAITSKTVRIPEFWDSTPQAWFVAVENLFRLKNIKSDSSKYQHVLAALPQHVVVSVLDILKDTANGYDALKKALVDRNSMSEEQRLNTLLSDSNAIMGDRRPSEFYRHLEQLADPSGLGLSKDLVLKLWMRRLPDTINVALVTCDKKEPAALTSIADKIWDAMHKDSIAAVQSNPIRAPPGRSQQVSVQPSVPEAIDPMTALCAGISEMCQQVHALRQEISELKHNQDYRGRLSSRDFRDQSRQRGNSRPRQFNRSRSRRSYDCCWFHYKFGSKATNCRQPCNFNKDSSASNEKFPKK